MILDYYVFNAKAKFSMLRLLNVALTVVATKCLGYMSLGVFQDLHLQHMGHLSEIHKMDDSLASLQLHWLLRCFLIHPQALDPVRNKNKLKFNDDESETHTFHQMRNNELDSNAVKGSLSY